MAYAEYSDVILRYPLVADQAQDRINALLEDAAAIIDFELEDAGIEVDPENLTQAQNLKSVSCSMVARASATDGMYGVSSLTQMAGPIQQSASYSNPTGDLYLTAGERRRLGISGGRGTQLYYSSDVLGGGEQ